MGWFTSGNAGDKEIVCKHCNNKGCVTTKKVTRKGGIDGGKVIAHAGLAVCTFGVSLIFADVHKDVPVTEMTCGKCGMKWDVT